MKTAIIAVIAGLWLQLICQHAACAEALPAATVLSFASADFDEDGNVDLAAGSAGPDSGSVTIFQGTGRLPGRRSKTGGRPELLFSGDWNGDGHFDLLAIQKGLQSAMFLLGDGKGGFPSRNEILIPGVITAAASGDFNRPDGLMDLVLGATRNGASSVRVYQSPAGTVFADAEEYPIPSPAIGIVIARLDEDAWADIAVVTSRELLIIHGRPILAESQSTEPATVESLGMPFDAVMVIAGNFSPAPGTELAFLSTDDQLHLLSGGSDGKWSWSAFSIPPASDLRKVRRTGSPQDDILMTGFDGHSYIWNESRPRQLQKAGTGRMFPMRLNGDALDDLVRGSSNGSLDVVLSRPSAAFTVNSVTDDPDSSAGDGICMTAGGFCTLRAAIQEADALPGVDSIAFAIAVPPATVPVITPLSPLPAVTEALTIDGATQPAGLVHLRGTDLPAATGLEISSGSSTIRGMAITEFAYGIRLDTGGNNFIEGNIIGLDPTGAIAMGNTYNGIRVGSTNNTIGGTTPAQRNIISANGGFSNFDQDNLFIDFGATGTLILGNYIGTDITGSVGLTSSRDGVGIAAINTSVGSIQAGAGNVISGNGRGIAIGIGAGVSVAGNLIGTDPSGTLAVPNEIGVLLAGSFAIVGGVLAAGRNTISGNDAGVYAADGLFETVAGSIVRDNYIGLNAAGTEALGNTTAGVLLRSSGVTVGDDSAGGGNVISGNGAGVRLGEDFIPFSSNNNRIVRNYIGTDPSGLIDIANNAGIIVDFGATGNDIGDTDPNNGNLISGNAGAGIQLNDAIRTRILNNVIGLDATGAQGLGNGAGIEDLGSTDSVIGLPGSGNVICSLGIGVDIHPPATNATIQGNLIGTDAGGVTVIGNVQGIKDEGAFTVIGGPVAGAGNVISGSLFTGIEGGYVVQGNLIGTDITGTVVLGNGTYGVYGAQQVGGDQPGEGNVISGNIEGGVSVLTDSFQVKGNNIGMDITGTVALGNGGPGILISASNGEIGGLNSGAANRIANNTTGVWVISGTGVSIHGNSIYTNAGLGIDLDPPGVTANDDGDTDAGPNLLQNFPVLISATVNGSNIIVEGTLNSAPSSQYTIEFYSNSTCDDSQHGEGEDSIGVTSLATDNSGNASFSIALAGLTPGSFVTATATDSSNNTSEYSRCIQIVSCQPISIAPPSLPDGQVGAAYSQLLSASGGTAPYIYSLLAGLPPPGINVNRGTGEVIGTPVAPGWYNFMIAATDSNNCTGTQLYSITISCGSIGVQPPTLPDGIAGSPYNAVITAAGGTGPYTFAIAGGSLPGGLSLDSSTGTIGGTPSAPGIFNFTIAAADAFGCTGTHSYTVTVSCTTISIQPLFLPDGVVGAPYNDTISATGGTGPYTFAVTAGSLPPGLSLDSGTGDMTGTPSSAGIFSFTITATDAALCAGLASYAVTIASSCLFCDDFEDGVLSPDWTYEKPLWTEPAGGNLIGMPSGKKAIAIATPIFSGCGNCTFESTISTAGGAGNRLSLLAWYVDKHNNVELMMKEESDKWVLKERINGNVVAKTAGAGVINPGQFYDVVMTFDGTQFTVTVDGTILMTLPSHGAHNGTIGFQVNNTTGSFAGITVN